MPKPRSHAAEFRKVLRSFALFGEPIRVVIFQRLARRPGTAGELAKELPVSRVAVVQHLKRLEAAGFVSGASEGRRRLYRVDPASLDPLTAWIAEQRRRAGER
jgi:DNA-binding transcriptional ArsR family regulator